MHNSAMGLNRSPLPSPLFLVLALALSIATYWIGLGGMHIPKLGDEFIYANIAFNTAQTGQWLPLQSELGAMRNTKPPLLFWQAMVAGDWGEHWNWLALRVPSVIYTMAIAALAGLVTWRLSMQRGESSHTAKSRALIAAIVFLAFFSSFRYGRPFITASPETFWIFSVVALLAWNPQAMLQSAWRIPLLAGLGIGIACLYKSFALIAPMALALGACYQFIKARSAPWQLTRAGLIGDVGKTLLASLVALAVFSLWFALDPDPQSVWNEFIVGENAGKFRTHGTFWKTSLSGSSSIWSILFGYVTNAGLIALPVAAALLWMWRSRLQLSDGEKVMLLFAFAFMVIFIIPTQRSARYLIPLMPAMAIFVALYWQQIGKWWWRLTLIAALLSGAVIALIAWRLQLGFAATSSGSAMFGSSIWLTTGATVFAAILGLTRSQWLRPAGLVISSVWVLCLWALFAPMEGPLGRYPESAIQQIKGQPVAVPNSFLGHFERYRMVVPGARIAPYKAQFPNEVPDADIRSLLKTHPLVIVQRAPGQAPCTDCSILAERWDIRGKSSRDMPMREAWNNPLGYWLAREYLVSAAP
jgi:4-amino-4-deoxy-L-arabinose transferase-like glycosyltransferase